MKTKSLLQKLIRMSRLSFYMIVVNCLALSNLFGSDISAQSVKSVRDVKIQLHLNNADIKSIFGAIENQSVYTFTYKVEDIDKRFRLSKHYNDAFIADILIDLSKQTGLKFKQINEVIHVVKVPANKKQEILEVVLQTRAVSGKVTGMDGEGLPGVNVIEKGTSNGTVTDIDGLYTLDVSEGSTLVFSSVGYTSEEVEIGGRSVINMSLVEDIKQLEELVVVGYGTEQKVNVIGSVSQITAEKINDRTTPQLQQALTGQFPGVTVIQRSG